MLHWASDMANQDQIIDKDKMDSKSAFYLKDFTEHHSQWNGSTSEWFCHAETKAPGYIRKQWQSKPVLT